MLTCVSDRVTPFHTIILKGEGFVIQRRSWREIVKKTSPNLSFVQNIAKCLWFPDIWTYLVGQKSFYHVYKTFLRWCRQFCPFGLAIDISLSTII